MLNWRTEKIVQLVRDAAASAENETDPQLGFTSGV